MTGRGGGAGHRETLTALGPSFIKAGQVLASRPDIIREDYMNELCVLQDDVPSFSDALVLTPPCPGRPSSWQTRHSDRSCTCCCRRHPLNRGTLPQALLRRFRGFSSGCALRGTQMLLGLQISYLTCRFFSRLGRPNTVLLWDDSSENGLALDL